MKFKRNLLRCFCYLVEGLGLRLYVDILNLFQVEVVSTYFVFCYYLLFIVFLNIRIFFLNYEYQNLEILKKVKGIIFKIFFRFNL